MRAPRLLRTTPFRLTLLFLGLFAAASALFLGYIYVVSAGEVGRGAAARVDQDLAALRGAYARSGPDRLVEDLRVRNAEDPRFIYRLEDGAGREIAGDVLGPPPALPADGAPTSLRLSRSAPDGGVVRLRVVGAQTRLGDLRLFVGTDVDEGDALVRRISRSVGGAGVLVVLLGLAGGLLVSRNVSRSLQALAEVLERVEAGDLAARAPVSGARDEYDEIAAGVNAMLTRIERLMEGVRHAGDAIAHDLRSPLTRFRARLEAALLGVEAGEVDPAEALEEAVRDCDQLITTFNAVLAISRLQASGAPDARILDPAEIAADAYELYQPICEARGVRLERELEAGLTVRGNREFLAQAVANLLDNAAKYAAPDGAAVLRARRRASGEVEISVTDDGPGIAEGDRARAVLRFVRLEESRSRPGAGLGLALVAAVAAAHGGRLELGEGPGAFDGRGPGLRAALVFPPA